jgi:hypothetical protein
MNMTLTTSRPLSMFTSTTATEYGNGSCGYGKSKDNPVYIGAHAFDDDDDAMTHPGEYE